MLTVKSMNAIHMGNQETRRDLDGSFENTPEYITLFKV